MLRRSKFKRFAFTLSIVCCGCGAGYNPTPFNGLFGGAALGAGSGALIGSMISNGDVAMSAALGAGVGAGLGLALVLLNQQSMSNASSYSGPDHSDEFRANQDEIFDNDRAIEQMREDLQSNEPDGMPNRERREFIYDGQTFGNVYR